MIRTMMKFDLESNESDIMCKALLPDIRSSDRANTVITSNDGLQIDITAQDVTALRATVNTVLRQIKLIEDVIKIGEIDDTKK